MAKDDRTTDETGSVKTKRVALGLGYFSLALGPAATYCNRP